MSKRTRVLAAAIFVASAISGCGGSANEKPAVAIEGTIVFALPRSHGEDAAGVSVFDADIYLLDADGTHVVGSGGFFNQSYPAWSPDGTQIAFITDSMQLAVVNRDGSGGATLTPELSDPSAFPGHPEWLRDGSISFVVGENLAVVRADGSPVEVLTLPGRVPDSFPAWAPDGKQIVFNCSRFSTSPAVCLIDVDSGESKTLLTPPRQFYSFDWSPDGTEIVAGDSTHGTDGDEEEKDVYVFGSDGSGLHALAQPGREQNPAWSPDGKMIVYDAFVEGSEGSDLWVMNADGSGAKQLMGENTGFQADWTAS